MELEQKRDSEVLEVVQTHNKQLKFDIEDTHLQLEQKRADYYNLENELLHWKSHCEKLNTENTSVRDVIQELEEKNRKLVEKLNQQIMQRVNEYKDKAMHALSRSDSPSKIRRAVQNLGAGA